ncbi:MAG: hypothetical protein AAGI30_05710, partial [Planctomycetota bacterium]
AVGLERTHTQAVRALEAHVDNEGIHIHALAEREPSAELWGADKKSSLLEKAFGTRVHVTWRSTAQANGSPSRAPAPPSTAKETKP